MKCKKIRRFPRLAQPRRLLTVKQVARRLRVGSRWVRNHARELTGLRVGRYYRFPEEAIKVYLRRRLITDQGGAASVALPFFPRLPLPWHSRSLRIR